MVQDKRFRNGREKLKTWELKELNKALREKDEEIAQKPRVV